MPEPLDIAVCVKQVLDSTVPLRIVDGAARQESPWAITRLGPCDRAALEQAMRLRARHGGRVAAFSVGAHDAVGALRFCLARGADRAVHVEGPDRLDPVGPAMGVATALAGEPAELVLCGERSGDGGSGLFPVLLAAQLDWPVVTGVAAVEVEGGGTLRVTRRLDRGEREIVRCPLPAVLAAAAGTGSEYVSVSRLARAAARPITTMRSEGPAGQAGELVGLEPPRPRPKRVSGPDAAAPATARIAHLLSGGLAAKQGGGMVQGAPAAVVAEIIRFLEERGFLTAPAGPRAGSRAEAVLAGRQHV